MAEIKDIFVGQYGIVSTVKTSVSLVDATGVFLKIAFPETVFSAISYDLSATTKFVDESNFANGVNKDDMNLLPSGGIQINDAYYFGATGKFAGIKFDISQDGVGTWVQAWEYWDGSSWTALSGLTDGTSNFMNKGERAVEWTIPGDWATTDVDDITDELYFIRTRVTTADATPTQLPLGGTISLNPVTLTGTIVNQAATNDPTDANFDKDNFGNFTVTIPSGIFEFPGTYFLQSKITTASGLFFGKVFSQPIKEIFAK